MPLVDPVRNFAKCTVAQGYDSNATSIVLLAGHGSKLPDPNTEGAFNLVWWSIEYPDPGDDPNVEIIRCTSKSGDTLTIERGQENTLASNKNLVNRTYFIMNTLTKKMKDDLQKESRFNSKRVFLLMGA